MTASRIFRAIGCPLSGAGKTTWLSTQSQIAAAKHGGTAVQIISLTRTAAAEIGSRETSIPAENCSTLHAACYRALDAPDLAETRASLREFAAAHPEFAVDDTHDLDLDDDAISDVTGDIHATCQNHRARMTPRQQWTPEEQAYGAAWDEFCRETQRMDFTSLIETCLRENVQPIANPRVLLVDEGQDMSTLEFALIKMWSTATETTVVVGDEAQAIYGWRGSDINGMGALDVTGERILKQSYRCSRNVRDLALAWMRESKHPVIQWAPTGQQGEARQADYSLREPDELVDDALALHGSVMILTTCGYMLEPVVRELRARGITYHNPHRTKGRQGAAWNPARGSTHQALAAYLRTDVRTHGDEGARPRTWGDLHAWTQTIVAKGNLARGAKAAIEEHCRTDEFGQTRANQPVPLDTLIELLGTPMHPALRNDVDWWRTALLAKHQRAGDYAVRVWQRDPRALTAEPKLQVGTAHSVKGAAASHVILSPDLSKEAYYAGWLSDDRAAVVKTLYVALTRARDTVRVMEPSAPECAPLDARDVGRVAA